MTAVNEPRTFGMNFGPDQPYSSTEISSPTKSGDDCGVNNKPSALTEPEHAEPDHKDATGVLEYISLEIF